MRARGLIEYDEIKGLSLRDAVDEILNTEKPLIGDLKMSDMIIAGDIRNVLLIHSNAQFVFGAGVYVFFENDIPQYVGSAKHLKSRLLSHLGNDLRPNWAWCAAKKIIAARDFANVPLHELSATDKDAIHKTLLSWGVVRINIYNNNTKVLGYKKLEKLIGGVLSPTLRNSGFRMPSVKKLNTELSKLVRP